MAQSCASRLPLRRHFFRSEEFPNPSVFDWDFARLPQSTKSSSIALLSCNDKAIAERVGSGWGYKTDRRWVDLSKCLTLAAPSPRLGMASG
jgi:hypothetical protein